MMSFQVKSMLLFVRIHTDTMLLMMIRKKITTQDEKLHLLLECMEKISKNPPEEMISIIYIFYSEDNEVITQNFPKIMIWNKEDLLKV